MGGEGHSDNPHRAPGGLSCSVLGSFILKLNALFPGLPRKLEGKFATKVPHVVLPTCGFYSRTVDVQYHCTPVAGVQHSDQTTGQPAK